MMLNLMSVDVRPCGQLKGIRSNLYRLQMAMWDMLSNLVESWQKFEKRSRSGRRSIGNRD